MNGTGSSGEDRLLKTFLDLVRIDSPTGCESDVASYAAAALRSAGLSVRMACDGSGAETGNVVAELRGTAPGLTIVLSAHMDTVEPGRGVRPVVADGVVRSSGDTILGGDDKAGIAAILETVRRIDESGSAHPPIRVLLTVGEEMGLLGAKALDAADCTGDLCLVLDALGVTCASSSTRTGSPAG